MNWTDGAGYIEGDLGIAVLFTLSALMTFARIAFEPNAKFAVSRFATGVGFCVLSIRMWTALHQHVDVIIAPLSLIGFALVCGGYCITQLRAISRAIQTERHPVWCIREPHFRCQREDRLRQALKEVDE